MGCCQSTPTDDAAPPRPLVRPTSGPVDARVRALNAAPDAISRSASTVDSRQSHDPPAPHLTGVSRPNKEIRPPSPLRVSPAHLLHQPPPWTRARLEKERAAFFDTRVTGRPEVWNALRLVCELLVQGNVTEAQGILDAANVSCPNGRIAAGKGRDKTRGGVYDEFGELYEIPAFVLADPHDLLDGEEKAINDDAEPLVDDSRSESDVQRTEKGKGRAADLGEIIQLRARLSDRGTDVTVTVGKKEKVATVIEKIQEQSGKRRMRLVYLGHVLQETKTLEFQNYKPGDVVNAYVFDGPEDYLRKQLSKR